MADIFVEANLLDIGYGMPVTLSSMFGTVRPAQLVPGSDPGAPFFRTEVEERPSITVDLLSVRCIHRIRLFNTGDEPGALPIVVSTSADGLQWTDMVVSQAEFGGKVAGAPLVVSVKYFWTARYVKVHSPSRATLRLHYIEICAPLPQEYLGRIRDIRVTETDVLADYWHHDSYGFAWTFTCTLGMILNARLVGVTIDRIDYRLCLREFKDTADADPYQALFEPRSRRKADVRKPCRPSSATASTSRSRSPCSPATPSCISVPTPRSAPMPTSWRRGMASTSPTRSSCSIAAPTSRWRSTRPPRMPTPPWLQRWSRGSRGCSCCARPTRCRRARRSCTRLPQAVWFRELPATSGGTAIHNLDVAAEFGVGKAEIAMRLLAMTYLVAQAKYVVTHTGNLGAWVAIYRGRPDGLYQFCADGKLRGPDGAVLDTALAPAG